MGSQSLLHLGALSVRLSEGSLVLMDLCSVRSNCVLYLVDWSIGVLSQASCVQWSVNGGQGQIDCGSSHQGCVSKVLSGIHIL